LLGAEYLTAVTSFGDLGIESLSLAFFGSFNLIDVPSVLPATVTDLSGLFASALSFNDDISAWNTANVTSMALMFADLIGLFSDSPAGSTFNQSLSSWVTSSVTNMGGMFYGASSFDQSLSSWVTSSVTDMSGMFADASSFDQSLSSWNVWLVANMQNMLDNSALSSANYAATLIGWANQTVKTNVVFGANGKSAGDSQGSAGCDAWRELIGNPNNWDITDSSYDDCQP
jgi:surface protein